MIRKNPDFNFHLILLLFSLAVLPMLFLGAQSRLSLIPFAQEENVPVTYTTISDQTNITKLSQLNYSLPTPEPKPDTEEILNAPNQALSKAGLFLLSILKQLVSLATSFVSQIGQ